MVNIIETNIALTGLQRTSAGESQDLQPKTHTSKPGRTCESQELNGRPPSRANDLEQTLALIPMAGRRV